MARLDELREDAEQVFSKTVDGIVVVIDLPGRLERMFDMCHPGDRLVEHASGADLLVVGARGHRGLAGVVLGSSTTWVIHHLACPTVVIPHPPED